MMLKRVSAWICSLLYPWAFLYVFFTSCRIESRSEPDRGRSFTKDTVGTWMGTSSPHPGKEKIIYCIVCLAKSSQLVFGLLHRLFEADLLGQISRRRVFEDCQRFHKLGMMWAYPDHIRLGVGV